MFDTIIKLLSSIISCTVGMIIVFDFMDNLYESKFYNKKIKIILYFVFTALWFGISLFGIPLLSFTYFVTITLIIGIFAYGAKNVKDILQIITFIISYAGCDNIISILLSIFTGNIPLYSKNATLFLINVIVVQTFMIAITKFLIIFFQKQKIPFSYRRKYIFLTILPIINILIIYIILVLPTNNQITRHLIIILMAIISEIFNLAVLYFFENISNSLQLENEITLMQQRTDMQYNYYQQLEIEYKKSQNIMHDIKNHIKVLERLYQSGQNAEGLEYAERISEIVEGLGMKFKSNNRILNIIVNEKIRICKDGHIDFTYLVENIDLSFISDMDVTTIFANLLDNAIEACNKIVDETKQITLRVYQFNNMIIINLINSIDNAPVQDEGKLISSKKNHKAIGLSNVSAAVEKYDGDINIEIEQKNFSVSIMIPKQSNRK